MITLKFKKDVVSVYADEVCLGLVRLSENPFHQQNCYVELELECYDNGDSEELFANLFRVVQRPLQAMIESEDKETAAFLAAGGFICKRRCYGAEVTKGDFVAPQSEAVLCHARRGDETYERCSRIMYECYREKHMAINPWTSDFAVFCNGLPADVYWEADGDRIVNLAFVEGNEIAYICSVDEARFDGFAAGLVNELFRQYAAVCFESDDCDRAAMRLRAMFVHPGEGSFDTYIYSGGDVSDRDAQPLEFCIPEPEDLWFYQKMMSDPATMSYNAGWDIDYDGYHRDTGCIDCPDEALPGWHTYWVGQEPERFYAYIKRSSDGAWIGDVNFHYNPERDWWDMGIVIYAPYRGMGYGTPALKLLLDRAFRVCGISRLHNEFETTRDRAWKIHREVGFKELGAENGLLQLMLTKEDYLANHP